MLLQIAVRVPDGSDPLGLLAASLRRHLSRLRDLSYAGAHLLDEDLDARAQALADLRDALTFFEHASDDPFREEAELLFPTLIVHAIGDLEIAQACATLSADRGVAAALHARIAAVGSALAGGVGQAGPLHELSGAVDELEQLYRDHLERLEAQLFPRAENAFSDEEKRALADQMLDLSRATVLPVAGPEQPLGAGLP